MNFASDRETIPTDSPGHPLDHGTRGFIESRFGTDFSDVRVHTDTRAAKPVAALAANAYTMGRDIYFAAGKHAPWSREGQPLLAHELTHTVQQGKGAMPIAASPVGSLLVGDVSDPLEAEVQQAANAIQQDYTPASSQSGAVPVGVDAYVRDTFICTTAQWAQAERNVFNPILTAWPGINWPLHEDPICLDRCEADFKDCLSSYGAPGMGGMGCIAGRSQCFTRCRA
jgi:hypothetical protein